MRRPGWPEYAMAVALVGAAFTLELLCWHVVGPALTPLFFAAVMLSALYGGLGPALLSTVLAAAAAAYFFIPPARSFEIGWDDALRLAIFILAAVVISGLNERRRRAEASLTAARDAAEQANRSKDRFLAILSHELRTPLTPVLITASSMEADERQPPDTREAMAMIRQNVQLQVRIIDDLLDLTRIERGKLHLQLQAVDVHELLRHTARIVRGDVEAKGLRLDLELGAARTRLMADPTRLQQVFWNLARNAIKFTPPGGRLLIRSDDAAPAALRVEFVDTGMGIEPHLLPHVFDTFQQGGAEVTARYGGLGLGLSISKSIVELHGGHLTASSRGKGQGATFAVCLNVAAPAPAPVPDAPAAPSESGPVPQQAARILLVEDHEDTAAALAKLLRRQGHEVHVACGVRAALDAAAREPFDVLVSDLGLPDGTGLELMHQLRNGGTIPAIALSGHGMSADVQASREAGFQRHLVKPVDLHELDAAIRALRQ